MQFYWDNLDFVFLHYINLTEKECTLTLEILWDLPLQLTNLSFLQGLNCNYQEIISNAVPGWCVTVEVGHEEY